jgi:hypothetical protein
VHCHPAAGQLVQIPKAEKSHRGVPGVIAYYMKAGVEELCVETKYDGERCGCPSVERIKAETVGAGCRSMSIRC